MNRPMHVPTSRMLFLRPRRSASLVPVYLAMLLLALCAVVVFLVAMWPRDDGPSARGPIDAVPAAGAQSHESGLRVAPEPKPRGRSTWM